MKKSLLISVVALFSSASFAWCQVDETKSPMDKKLDPPCTKGHVDNFGNGDFTGAKKIELKLPAIGSGKPLYAVKCTITENTGSPTSIRQDNYSSFPGVMHVVSASGQDIPLHHWPDFEALFPMPKGATFTIVPTKSNEDTTGNEYYINFDNPECPTAGKSCQWNMTCELGPKVPS